MATTRYFETPLGDDRRSLAEFITEVESLLGDALADPSTWFPTDLHDPLQAAWEEVKPSFAMAKRYVTEPPDANLLEAQLAHVGLTGGQLIVKRRGWERARDRFRQRLTKRALRRALGWANIILGSLAGLIPGGDAIKEYKEVAEQAIEDTEPDDDEGESGPTRSRTRHWKI